MKKFNIVHILKFYKISEVIHELFLQEHFQLFYGLKIICTTNMTKLTIKRKKETKHNNN